MQLAPLTHSNESSQSPRSLSSDPTVATQQQQQHEIMAAEGSSEPPGVTKPKPHQCQICGRGFTTGGHLQRHQRIHTGVKAFKCPYPGCETRTSRQDNLQQHYRTHLSPSIRRGSGSAARAAVARAMEEAGIRPAAGSRQRKAKSTTASSSSSSTHAPSAATQSLYGGSGTSTPSYGSGAYSAYEPLSASGQGHPGYQSYPLHHAQSVSGFATPSSASSSRVPSPAPNGHPVNGVSHHPPYFPSAYPQNPYSYSQPTNLYYAQPPQSTYAQAHAQSRLYAPAGIPPHHQPVYSPINPSSFDSRHAPYSNVLPSGYAAGYPSRPGAGAQTPQPTDSRQSSIAPSAGDEPQNAAQAYSYHAQRQHSTSSLHSDYQRGAALTQSPPTNRRMSPPPSGTSGVIDPASVAARTNPVLPAPVTAPGYPSYLQQQQHVAAQRAFSDSYTQLARTYDDRFAPAPPGGGARPYEEELSNSGSEGSAPARQAPTHAYAQPAEHRYPTSPVISLQDKPPPASHVKEIVNAEWAGDRRVW